MPSKADTERECAALKAAAIKESDRLRAEGFTERDRLIKEAEKAAAATRSGADDERLRKLMQASPRRVELLQDIKALEKEKSKLKGDLETHQRECAKERQGIILERDAARAETTSERTRVLTNTESEAKRIIADGEAHLLRQAERRIQAARETAEAEIARAEADGHLRAVLQQIADGEAKYARQGEGLARMKADVEGEVARLKTMLSLWAAWAGGEHV